MADVIGPQGPRGFTGLRGPRGNTGGAGFWQGPYDSAVTYAKNDTVSRLGSCYICLAASTGNVPEALGTFWAVVASKGDTGANGADSTVPGPAGASGSVWRNGSGVPSNGTGADGDYYLNTANGDVYQRSSGTYSNVGNIKGAAGSNGSNGSVWRNGSGTPSNSLGVDGDYYLDVDAGYVSKRISGSYTVQGNIKGPQGDIGPDMTGQQLLDAINATSDRTLKQHGGIPTVDWGNRYVIDASNNESLNWNDRLLYNSSNTALLDWTGLTSSTPYSFNPSNQLVGDSSQLSVMTGASDIANGTAGIVPQPVAGDDVKFLGGDGQWKTVTVDTSTVVPYSGAANNVDLGMFHLTANAFAGNGSSITNIQGYNIASTVPVAQLPPMVGDSGSGGGSGLVPAPAAGDANKFLKGDGTWGAASGSTGLFNGSVTITVAASIVVATYASSNNGPLGILVIQGFGSSWTITSHDAANYSQLTSDNNLVNWIAF